MLGSIADSACSPSMNIELLMCTYTKINQPTAFLKYFYGINS